MNKAIFLDRDGVINKKMSEGCYVASWQQFEFLPNTLEALKILSPTEYKLIIITNQRGIAKGVLTINNLDEIHSKMLMEIENHGGRIDKIYFCPHEASQCNCRKPLPGMLERAQEKFNIDFLESYVIGDGISDIQAGLSKNCKTIYLGNKSCSFATHLSKNLYSAVRTFI